MEIAGKELIASVFGKVGKNLVRMLTPEEELVFLREVINNVNANIYINQIDDVDDFSSAHMVWGNKSGIDMMGYSPEEVHEMGNSLWEKTMHPDDVPVSWQAIDFHSLKQGDVFGGVMRQITKGGRCLWYLAYCKVLKEKNGKPWQFLNVALNIQDELQTKTQLMELQKENNKLKNQLILSGLSRREKEVLRLISNGKTDREIAVELSISQETCRTHRKNLLGKLNKKRTASLIVFAVDNGLV